MPSVIDRFDWGRVLKWLVMPVVIYVGVAYATDAERLNPTLILVLISLSAAVSVAFLRQFYRFFLKNEPVTPVAVACLGIFAGWVSNVMRPAVPLAITLFPSLAWVRDSDAVSAGLAVAIYAGLCHLLAPAVTEFGEIPPRKWARAGAWVGMGLFAALVVFYWPRILAVWEGQPVGDFRAAWHIPGGPTERPDASTTLMGRDRSEDIPLDGSPTRGQRRLVDSVAAGVTPDMWDRIERHRAAQGEKSTAAAVRDLLGAALDAEDKADGLPQPGR